MDSVFIVWEGGGRKASITYASADKEIAERAAKAVDLVAGSSVEEVSLNVPIEEFLQGYRNYFEEQIKDLEANEQPDEAAELRENISVIDSLAS